MESLACLNGELMPVDQARIPVWDRGFLFGDSVYEVLRIYQGRCWLEEAHTARLRRSLSEMMFPAIDVDLVFERAARTISASRIEEGTVYIHLTRGVAPRAHAFPDPPVPPTELIVVRPFDDAPVAAMRQRGVAVMSQPDVRWGRCDVKSTNLLGNVLAHEAAHRGGCFEAVLVDRDDLVTEATHSSLLWVRGGRLEATPEGPNLLPGTTRHSLLELAGTLGIPYSDARVTLDELKAADEVILAGTTIEILPVITIDGKDVGDGRPGPVARRLLEANQAAIERWLAPAAV